ncbi:MAG TPA: lipoate--protein ligase family protein [Burkholderiaceae bacterium]|nr:lipoate--protein ligase family protein [Burkholderiaceae bacterium]
MPEVNADLRPRFTLLTGGSEATQDARHDEFLLEQVTSTGPLATIWAAQQSLVVPRSYRRYENFDEVCKRFTARGWPVSVRQTGGGIVPQGPGILNLSLAYAVNGPPMQHSEPGYELICTILAESLQAVGIDGFPATVDGSFCDGRYNLAVLHKGQSVKIAGTAQSWRRVSGSTDTYLGLVHALVLVDVDTTNVTTVANAFEAELGSGREYSPDKVISIAAVLGQPGGLRERYRRALVDAVYASALSD